MTDRQHDDFSHGAAYVDGEVVPIDQAKISILDSGFGRSDVTYDVVAVWEGAFFRLDRHVDRFLRSAQALRMAPPLHRGEIIDVLTTLVRTSGLRESFVEMVCTRGVPAAGSRDPRTYVNRFYAYAIPYVWILRPEQLESGMDAFVSRRTRRIPADSVDPTVKNFHWADLTRAQFEAYDQGAHFPILLGHDGLVTEGAGYNVFALVGDEFVTPSSGVLEGVTRQTVLDLAAGVGLASRVDELTEEQLRGAQEVFATSTAGAIGHRTRSLHQAYWQAHRDPEFITPVSYD
jgi:branched-chain amino acid aminotransferase